MLIKKIKEIKNIDAFDSFEWKGDDLKKFNLIYGWNGSGKTTISRIFYSLENKKIVSELGAAEFNISTDDGLIKNQNLTNHTINVKVFNEDFVRDNLRFNESKAKKILIVGKESTETSAAISILETQVKIKQEELKTLVIQREIIPDLGTILTEAGREVIKQFTNTPLGSGTYYGRSYDRRKVELLINNGSISAINIDARIILKQEDIDRKREIIKSQKTKITLKPEQISDFSSIFEDANKLLDTVITVEAIEELKDDKALREWTETGYYLHKDRKAEFCLFCKKIFDEKYLDRFAKLFTTELQDTKKQIDSAIAAINLPEYKGEIGSIEAVSFFPDLSAEYLSIKSAAEEKARIIRAAIEKMVSSLSDKRENLHNEKIYSAVIYPANAIKEFNELAQKIADVISKHNEQIDKISEAAKDIELHTIADVLKKKEYFQKKTEVGILDEKIKKLKDEIETFSREIKTKKASILSASLAIDKINESLKEFFGESHIYLEADPSGSEVGYILKRRGKSARNLSQGEKSVIALTYFLVKLEEDGFNKEESLIVIDDPVDSQDEMFLFKTYGLMKRYLARVGQLIIFTHNFPFFNLIRDWFILEDRKCIRSKMPSVSDLYSIRCNKTQTSHITQIEPLHNLLRKYKTEYHYLFYQLYKFDRGEQSIDEPLVPNIGRKILEYFAGFKWSCDVAEEFGNIIHNRFKVETKEKKEVANYVEKFIQEYSHGRDFARPVTASIFEAKSVAHNILLFIEIADSEHYEKLKALCES